MSIPESQLDTWSHQGSVTQSSATYNTIKRALESADSTYADKKYAVFLQGSYGNDTNIYSESDVDIVIRLDSCFHHDLDDLPAEQKAAFQEAHSDATYCDREFKRDVMAHLKSTYGGSMKPGDKAVKIEPSGNRRSADVIIAVQYRRYYSYLDLHDARYATGICFRRADGTLVANYPKQHSENCTTKHQATYGWFKPVVRILKNMRTRLVADKVIEAGVAPSYYIEGLLYNVPDEKFGESYDASFVNCINWILEADRSKFLCANKQYYLLREGSPVTWRDSKCNEFLTAVCDLWKQW
jgi:hypothetical protein